MSLAILFHFLCAQHVSDINISIIRSVRLFCWVTTLVVLFLVRCVLEIRCGWSFILQLWMLNLKTAGKLALSVNNVKYLWRLILYSHITNSSTKKSIINTDNFTEAFQHAAESLYCAFEVLMGKCTTWTSHKPGRKIPWYFRLKLNIQWV